MINETIEGIAIGISLISLTLSLISVYFQFFREKAKLNLSGPIFNPVGKEWGVYISNVGNIDTLIYLLEVYLIFDERKVTCGIRTKQETYELRHPKEYKLYWITYHGIHRKDVEQAKKREIYLEIKYFTGKKFKVFKKQASMPEEEFQRFLATLD